MTWCCSSRVQLDYYKGYEMETDSWKSWTYRATTSEERPKKSTLSQRELPRRYSWPWRLKAQTTWLLLNPSNKDWDRLQHKMFLAPVSQIRISSGWYYSSLLIIIVSWTSRKGDLTELGRLKKTMKLDRTVNTIVRLCPGTLRHTCKHYTSPAHFEDDSL